MDADRLDDVCLTAKSAADDCSVVDKGADLRAFVAGDNTWQFRSGLTLQPGADLLTFGVGTTGNNSLTPNHIHLDRRFGL